jgi:hypothetical protein
LNGKVVYQDEKVSHVRFPTLQGDEEWTDTELEAAVDVYNLHLSLEESRPNVGTKVRIFRGRKGCCNGEVTSQTVDHSLVLLEDGTEVKLTDKELKAATEAFNLQKLKHETGKKMAQKAEKTLVPELLPKKNKTGILKEKKPPAPSSTSAAAAPSQGAPSKNWMAQHDLQTHDSNNERTWLIGKKLRQSFEKGWCDGTVVSVESDKAIVRFEDGEEDEILDEEELQVAIKAHKMYHSSGVKRPAAGTKIRKCFAEGFYDGAIVATLENRISYVLYATGDEECITDEEASVAALAYKMHYESKGNQP